MCTHTHTHTHTHTQMPLMSPPLSPPPTSSPLVPWPSPSPVTMTVSHLLPPPGSTMAPLSLQQTISLAQTSCAPTWGRTREGHTSAMQAMWLAVTVLTSMLSYKVCVHACSIPVVCVCVIVATMRQFVIVVIYCWQA